MTNQNKTIWQKWKAWVNGEEALLHPDAYIAKRAERKKRSKKKTFNMRRMKENPQVYHFLCVSVCAAFIGILLAVVAELPSFGAAENPTNNEVMERYLEKGMEETGAINFVTGMILDYRAFDTFGEANVLFLAVIGVWMLLQRDRKNFSAEQERECEEDAAIETAESKTILQIGVKYLTPMILLYGVYVICNGHLSPGGGFSGGAIIGGGLILYAAAYGQEKVGAFLTKRRFLTMIAGSLLTYFACKSYSFFTGANHVGYAIPKGTPGEILSAGWILPLNICVGLVVACTMYGFYALFTKGEL